MLSGEDNVRYLLIFLEGDRKTKLFYSTLYNFMYKFKNLITYKHSRNKIFMFINMYVYV